MAQKNENNKNEEKNTTMDSLETIFSHYEEVYRGRPLYSHESTKRNDADDVNTMNDIVVGGNDNDMDYHSPKYNYNQNNKNNRNELSSSSTSGLKNNKGEKKKNENLIETGMNINNMDVGIIKEDINKNTDMDMYMKLSMPISTKEEEEQETTKTELNKNNCPVWNDGIDRFTNWLARPNLSPSSLMSSIKEILGQLNQENALFMTTDDQYNNNNNSNNNNSKNGAKTEALTYVSRKNLLLCRIVLSEYQISEFQIGIYLDKSNDCLLDIQELSGEHLTFAHFLHMFKTKLQQQEILDTSTPELDNYEMSMALNLDSFDEM